MVDGQSFSGGICPDCKVKLPPMIDDRGWGLAHCPKCDKTFDTHSYVTEAGGHFNNNSVCTCDRCTS